MEGFLVWFLALLFLGIMGVPTISSETFDVTEFGAVGDGMTDDTKAFGVAWGKACNESSDNPRVVVPSGKTFLVFPITFEGPCKSGPLTFQILGSIVAPVKEAWESRDVGVGQWVYFARVEGLSVLGDGQGVFDGQGDSWWGGQVQEDEDEDQENAPPIDRENRAPTALRFSNCNQLQISGLQHKNSQRNHISINGCNHANISKLHIIAPEKSPNTDGIDISSSSNLNIQDSVMETGDDCIAINGGSSSLYISNITCGPGHGISVGSLGRNGKREEVEGIQVDNCTFIKTQNGVRIKTWQGGSGFARNITFSNITFESADHPVIIDQYYCPHQTCNESASAVEVSGVKYLGLHGTSMRGNGTINLSCSRTVACTGIVADDLNITSVGPENASSICINAHGTSNRSFPALDCLLP